MLVGKNTENCLSWRAGGKEENQNPSRPIQTPRTRIRAENRQIRVRNQQLTPKMFEQVQRMISARIRKYVNRVPNLNSQQTTTIPSMTGVQNQGSWFTNQTSMKHLQSSNSLISQQSTGRINLWRQNLFPPR